MSLYILTLTAHSSWLSADSYFYEDASNSDAMMDDMTARVGVTTDAETARAAMARPLPPVKLHAIGDKLMQNGRVAMASVGALLPFAHLASAVYEARTGYDDVRRDLAGAWAGLAEELRALPVQIIATGYSARGGRMAALLLTAKAGVVDVLDLSCGHSMMPTPTSDGPGYPAIEASWESAAHGLCVPAFHEAAARNCAALWRGRIGGPLRHARCDRRGVTMSVLADLSANTSHGSHLAEAEAQAA